jgi:hypothetical protein
MKDYLPTLTDLVELLVVLVAVFIATTLVGIAIAHS